MGIIGGTFGYRILKAIAPPEEYARETNNSGHPSTPLTLYFGDRFFEFIRGKTVIDFGCGAGNQAIEIALNGAGKVIGVDIQQHLLKMAQEKAEKFAISERCRFCTETVELADVIISKDAFEHFEEPYVILKIMSSLLKPEGVLLAAFGPTWLHPYGGHLFSVFPWAHLIFTENALIRWRSEFKSDDATRFSEVDGGLNQLTIREFERIVKMSPFQMDWMDTIPIKRLSFLKHPYIQEIGSSIVQCQLSLKERAA